MRNYMRKKPIVPVRMTPETKEWLMKQAEIFDTSIGNMIRTAILLMKKLLEDPDKIYEEINKCLWLELKEYVKGRRIDMVSIYCIYKLLLDKLVKEAERL